jgi:hypothetical protein
MNTVNSCARHSKYGELKLSRFVRHLSRFTNEYTRVCSRHCPAVRYAYQLTESRRKKPNEAAKRRTSKFVRISRSNSSRSVRSVRQRPGANAAVTAARRRAMRTRRLLVDRASAARSLPGDVTFRKVRIDEGRRLQQLAGGCGRDDRHGVGIVDDDYGATVRPVADANVGPCVAILRPNRTGTYRGIGHLLSMTNTTIPN